MKATLLTLALLTPSCAAQVPNAPRIESQKIKEASGLDPHLWAAVAGSWKATRKFS
ncbi:MAG: hypothetical protein WED15_08250 [Akkermansiaceae bacterium]